MTLESVHQLADQTEDEDEEEGSDLVRHVQANIEVQRTTEQAGVEATLPRSTESTRVLDAPPQDREVIEGPVETGVETKLEVP